MEREHKEISGTHKTFSTIFEFIPTPLFVKDVADDFRYVIVNRAFCEAMGYERRDLIDRNDFDTLPEERAKFFLNSDIEAVKLK